jgi:glycosyltransferase involved in cell wall biosynthesis
LFHCSGPTWGFVRFLKLLRRLLKGYPRTYVHLIANTDEELRCFRRTGFAAGYGPVSLYVDGGIFTPEASEKCFDAVYVAHFTPGDRGHFKRHHLAAGVPSLSIITNALSRVKRSMPEVQGEAMRGAFYETYPELRHAEVNDHYLSPVELARGVSRARVNLALSAAEGCMLGFTEGLLCGVPGVSTPCESARTEFFDPRFVRVVNPDANAVAEGVREMVARNLDPAEVRTFALERQQNMRVRYSKYVAGIAKVQAEAVYAHLFEQAGGIRRLAYAPSTPPPAAPPAPIPASPSLRLITVRRRWRGGSAGSRRY